MAFSVELAIRHLENAHRQGRLAHGYLITGEDTREEEELAISIIAMVNAESGESLESVRSEYVHLVQPESKSRRITVTQIRELEKRLYMGAPSGKTKVAVIQEADRLGVEAENAFLKTLEEPPEGSLILLLTSHPQQLLETILSRCIQISLRVDRSGALETPEQELLLKLLEDHLRARDAGVSGALGLAGRFGEILKTMKSEITKRNEGVQKEEVKMYDKRTEGDWLSKREDYFEALSATEYIEKRNRLVDTLLAVVGDALRQREGVSHLDLASHSALTEEIGRRHGQGDLSRRFGALERLRSLLDTNTNEKLVLEVTFVEAFA